jgi:hypothetical protein
MKRKILKKGLIRKGLVLSVIVLFIGVSLLSSAYSKNISNSNEKMLAVNIELIDNTKEWDTGIHHITITATYDLQVLEMNINSKPIFEGDNIIISGEVINQGENLSPIYIVKNQLYKNSQHYHTFNDEGFEPLSSESWRGFGPQSNETNEDDAGTYKLVTTIQVDGVTVDEEEEYFFVWPKNRVSTSPLLIRFLERYPLLNLLLQRLRI